MATFNSLPYEIQDQIFEMCLPGPRVLHIIKKDPSQIPIRRRIQKAIQNITRPASGGPSHGFSVTPASSGGAQPSLLSLTPRSRAFALSRLTLHLGMYWNLLTDYAYFEIHDIRDKHAMWMTEMFEAGLLAPFRNIAIDAILAFWKASSSSMEFKYMHGRDFVGFIEPTLIMSNLPHMKNCVYTYTDHTLQQDLVTKGQPWILGEVNEEVTLNPAFKDNYTYQVVLQSAEKHQERRRNEISESEDAEPEGFDLRVMGIHGREREVFPPGKQLRPDPLPQNYYDWFG